MIWKTLAAIAGLTCNLVLIQGSPWNYSFLEKQRGKKCDMALPRTEKVWKTCQECNIKVAATPDSGPVYHRSGKEKRPARISKEATHLSQKKRGKDSNGLIELVKNEHLRSSSGRSLGKPLATKTQCSKDGYDGVHGNNLTKASNATISTADTPIPNSGPVYHRSGKGKMGSKQDIYVEFNIFANQSKDVYLRKSSTNEGRLPRVLRGRGTTCNLYELDLDSMS